MWTLILFWTFIYRYRIILCPIWKKGLLITFSYDFWHKIYFLIPPDIRHNRKELEYIIECNGQWQNTEECDKSNKVGGVVVSIFNFHVLTNFTKFWQGKKDLML